MLACNHTDCVHIQLLSCFSFVFSLLILCLNLLTPVPLQQQGAPLALCLILRHMCLNLCNHILTGTWNNCITERSSDNVEPCLLKHSEVYSLVIRSLFSPFLTHSTSPSLSLHLTLFYYTHTHKCTVCTLLPCSIDHLRSTSWCIMSSRKI